MKKPFYYCLAIAFGTAIGWFADPNHQPQSKPTISQETVNTIDSLQTQLTWYQMHWAKITDSLGQADGE